MSEFLGPPTWYPSEEPINKSRVEAFRITTSSSLEFSLGLDIMLLLED